MNAVVYNVPDPVVPGSTGSTHSMKHIATVTSLAPGDRTVLGTVHRNDGMKMKKGWDLKDGVRVPEWTVDVLFHDPYSERRFSPDESIELTEPVSQEVRWAYAQEQRRLNEEWDERIRRERAEREAYEAAHGRPPVSLADILVFNAREQDMPAAPFQVVPAELIDDEQPTRPGPATTNWEPVMTALSRGKVIWMDEADLPQSALTSLRYSLQRADEVRALKTKRYEYGDRYGRLLWVEFETAR